MSWEPGDRFILGKMMLIHSSQRLKLE